ncbi:hypothetical protein DSO57_1007734 [Entomophthora muscae]|uniref:Uncharacterized protein n=1 Tax=Entomophthora muscae TaxID=34485 RepID=A0ACC2TID4_9FUNG|nr:hypothetical protein DSO57_1007734 [Entomophthora muscae]
MYLESEVYGMKGWKRAVVVFFCVLGTEAQSKIPPRWVPQEGLRVACQETYVRREIRELSRKELREFHVALATVKRSGVLDNLCKMHLDYAEFTHATPYFLPWHRQFTHHFERQLRKVNPRVSLPYWNWSLDSQAPERSVVLSEDYFGSQGSKCLSDGPLTGWRCRFPEKHCLSRSYDGGETISAFYSPELLSHTLDGRKTYDEFRRAIEGPPHGNVHNNIGGDMSTMTSCNDPLFYLHHAFVDKLWLDWQSRESGREKEFGGKRADGSQASVEDEILPFGKQVKDALNANTSYCYSYSAGPLVPTRVPSPQRIERRNNIPLVSPGPLDREDMLRIRIPRPLSDEYIAMFGLNRTGIREQEKLDRDHVEALNLEGYISNFALGVNGMIKAASEVIMDGLGNILSGQVLKNLPGVLFG